MEQDVTLVPIPTALYQRVAADLDQLGVTSVEAFVANAVRSALAGHEAAPTPAPDEEAMIVERLRRLGYID